MQRLRLVLMQWDSWDTSYVCEFLLGDELDIFHNLDNKIDVSVHLIPQQTFWTKIKILNYCPFNLSPAAAASAATSLRM